MTTGTTQDMSTTMFPQSFGTSTELFAWLRSAEGGRLLVRDDEVGRYAIIYYNKKTSSMELPHVRACRSVVWDKETNAPVMVAPAYGYKFGVAVDHGISDFVTEEFVDGVMINMFYDPVAASWLLATRTQLGATNSFFGKRSFAELFWETFSSMGLTQAALNTAATYSWVLQHPEERVVVAAPYGIARLTLVQTTDPNPQNGPTTYKLKTLEDVKLFVTVEGRKRGVQWQGVVLKANGNRYKLRSNEYDEARYLRGNQPKRPFTWLELWGKGRLNAYLRIYPEEQCDAEAVTENFKACTQELHDLYMAVYRRKEFPLGKAPQKYRKLLWEAHQAGKGSYFPNLRDFMNEQDTARKLWLVNYEVRYGAAHQDQPVGQAEVRDGAAHQDQPVGQAEVRDGAPEAAVTPEAAAAPETAPETAPEAVVAPETAPEAVVAPEVVVAPETAPEAVTTPVAPRPPRMMFFGGTVSATVRLEPRVRPPCDEEAHV